eukprot:5853452-Pyramimonas_sp.AAC.1
MRVLDGFKNASRARRSSQGGLIHGRGLLRTVFLLTEGARPREDEGLGRLQELEDTAAGDDRTPLLNRAE